MEFKDKFKLVRKSLGLNQTEFGKAFGLSQRVISDIETGKSNPSKTLREYFIYRYGDKIPPEASKSSPGSAISGKDIPKPYPTTEHIIGPVEKEPEPGSYGVPELDRHKVVKVYERPDLGELIKQFKNKERVYKINEALLKLETLDYVELDHVLTAVMAKVEVLERFKKNRNRD